MGDKIEDIKVFFHLFFVAKRITHFLHAQAELDIDKIITSLLEGW
jgi:hypothetical protein